MKILTTLPQDDLKQVPAAVAAAEAAMGFVPNSMLTMAHMAQLPLGFMLLTSVVFGRDLEPVMKALAANVPDAGPVEENLSPELVQLVAFASSMAAGCRYCQAHTSHSAHRQGATDEKLAARWTQ